MNVLPIEKQIEVIAILAEGCSIRAASRLAHVHRDTVMRLAQRIGEGCRQVHDRLFCHLHVPLIQIDEFWSYVGKKEKRVTAQDGSDVGDQYIFTALDPVSRCLLATHIGKRTLDNAIEFLRDLRGRLLNRPHINSDAFAVYPEAIACTFGTEVDYAQIIKPSKDHVPQPSLRPRSPYDKSAVRKTVIWGQPRESNISTSLVERSNLTARQHSRRLARTTTGFSKKLRNHRASMHLLITYYNLCREHSTLGMTPGMALGVTDHAWTLAQLIHAALQPDDLPERMSPFTLIPGDLS